MEKLLKIKAILLSIITFSMVPLVASAHDAGFVHDASEAFTKTSDGCLHTMRWVAGMGECGAPPVGDSDSDGDGVKDDKDKCPGTPGGVVVDKDGCGVDSDGDGIVDYQDACPGTLRGRPVDTRGCEKIRKIMINDVNFEFNLATLKDSAIRILDLAAAKINHNSATVKSVLVTGYTDSAGSEDYNKVLSQHRANAVKSYLESKGVTGITAIGAGEANPVADNDTAAGREANRRAEIEVRM